VGWFKAKAKPKPKKCVVEKVCSDPDYWLVRCTECGWEWDTEFPYDPDEECWNCKEEGREV